MRRTNKVDARDLTLELALLFRSMDEEESLASPVPEPPPLTDVEMYAMEDRFTVARLMNEECAEAGCIADFRTIPTLMAQGSPKAEAVWKSKAFKTHWDYYEDATWKLALGPRSELPMPRLIAFPLISDQPSSPNVGLYQQTGLFSGLALGGLVGYRRSHRIMVPKNPDKAGSGHIPAYAKVDPPSLPSSPEARARPHSPEDDW